ncbi:acetyl/propionyl/methylcrotonyl-CoA carboxylase subunit alpha [Rheinheimera sp. MMS21-TC3]|uniref:acetyl/propionyl/methylcrotonyl-CoA carboxylase subunit alpha n=1 Tax=Rheinheimera sp. MMS21-TC3 TaxID=3072790 RepID=UPI0028C4AF7C|nr:acetyl/propionyl/methylcrotonyl-CoA carboxylase subunit alpha [Rheinheimera sp. MMS21-TC3]WNO61746.1 acetyl/propionyl/methylcrotonyl-CoA carboxylase subunit alpha [Rheinheimera sp. MMS21-TC3]
MFQKILIANRGEIACRIIDTAHKLGIRCVAVYSEADANARHVRMADEAYLLGPAPSKDSYLRLDKIIAIAQKSGAQAIHPGYGFLAENEQFAQACADANIVFIGPPVSAITAMGSKSAAKNIMQQAGVPLVPGYHGEDQSDATLAAESAKVGYPQLLKAAYGGGGKGMRVVWSEDEFASALAGARREATAGFGNDKMLIERYLTKPRHIEIQVFADNHGNAVYLAERDCSIQRRHQKVIEEAPAPNFTQQQREAMGEAAVKAAQAIDYRGAGTVEFLFDEDGSFYFMEMNTRLQVEHPVTEMITGQDLVSWQLLIAAGEPLPLSQDQVQIDGHAIEVRVYAEDPDNDFLPATGKLTYLRQPEASRYVRVDTGVVENDEVSPFYDPMIAKLIVWDKSRDRAINRMLRALEDYQIAGVTTNLGFLTNLADHPAFKAAQLDTNFINQHHDSLFAPASEQSQQQHSQALALAALYILLQQASQKHDLVTQTPWQMSNGWQLNTVPTRIITLLSGEEQQQVTIEQHPQHYQLQLAAQSINCQAELTADHLSSVLDNHRIKVKVSQYQDTVSVFIKHQRYDFTYQTEVATEGEGAEHAGNLTAPMNGTVVAVLVDKGSVVKAGDTLVIMEAMKMEYSIKATQDGTVNDVFYAAGDLVQDGAELVDFTADE